MSHDATLGVSLQRVLNAFAAGRCYACGWPLGSRASCEPFNCAMRFSDDAKDLAEKEGWHARQKEMSDVFVHFTSTVSETAPLVAGDLKTQREIHDSYAPSATRLNTVPIAKMLLAQRDECADALRALVAVVDNNFPMPAGVHPGSPLDRARKALANVPTYEQRLANILEAIK